MPDPTARRGAWRSAIFVMIRHKMIFDFTDLSSRILHKHLASDDAFDIDSTVAIIPHWGISLAF